MNYSLLLIGVTIALATFNVVVFAIIVTRFRKSRGIWQVGMLFLQGFVYAGAYAFELLSTTVEARMFFNHIQYLAIPFISVTWLYIARIFENPDYKLTFKKAIGFLIIPFAVSISVQLFPYVGSGIYYTSYAIDTEHLASNFGLAVLVLGKGPLYYVAALYNTFVLSIVATIYVRFFRAKKGIRGKESIWLAACSIGSMLAVIPVLFTDTTSGIDFSLYSIIVIAYIILYTMVKYESFDLTPSAHRATFELSSDPMMILDDIYDIVSWNQSFTISGAKPPHYHLNIEEYFTNKEIIESIKTKKAFGFTFNNKHFILETIPLISRAKTATGYIIKFNDMTSYIARIEKLDYEATHDELTKIYNRRAILDRAAAYLLSTKKAGQPFALLMMDIDDFKTINDSFGHVTGDFVLEELSRLVQQAAIPESIFARYGGEEFLMILQNTAGESARQSAEHVRKLIDAHEFVYNNLRLHITISIGISAGIVEKDHLIQDFINKADDAMYKSKKAGKNRVTLIE